MLDGEREPRRATVELCPVCGATNIAGNKYCYGRIDKHDAVRFEWVEVQQVEPGHDEQTERLNTGEAGDIADEFMAAQQAWQPDPATVAAVVEALREQVRDKPMNHYARAAWGAAAYFIEERFKPSAPGGGNAGG